MLKLSGLELENLDDINLDDGNCSDFQIIEDIIANSNVKNEKFNYSKLYQIFDLVSTEIYNK